jgi:LuxR family maltose regulon positive regulatory protein/serine/threonine-protein kinase PknK
MNKQIASELGLTVGTVKWYMQQIFSKLAVRRRSQAIHKARVLGFIR